MNVLHQSQPHRSSGKIFGILSFVLALLSVLGFLYLWLVNGAPRQLPTPELLKNALSGEMAGTQQGQSGTQANGVELEQVQGMLSQFKQQQAQSLMAIQDEQAKQGEVFERLNLEELKSYQLSEAEYLLRLANHRLVIANDPSGATLLLEQAEKLIASEQNTALFPIQKQINAEINNLNNLEKLDVQGVYAKLSALSDELNELPQFEAPTVTKETETVAEQEDQAQEEALAEQVSEEDKMLQQLNEGSEVSTEGFAETVQSAAAASGSAIGRAFDALLARLSIRYHKDFKPEALLTSSEYGLFIQHVQLLIEQAKVALLNNNEPIYQQSLEQAEKLVARYTQKVSSADTIRQQLIDLQAVNLNQQKPDISASLTQLHKYLGKDKKPIIDLEQSQESTEQNEEAEQDSADTIQTTTQTTAEETSSVSEPQPLETVEEGEAA